MSISEKIREAIELTEVAGEQIMEVELATNAEKDAAKIILADLTSKRELLRKALEDAPFVTESEALDSTLELAEETISTCQKYI
jgi:hypothetical protein